MQVFGALLLTGIAFLWMGLIPSVLHPNSSDAAGNAMSEAFEAVYAILIWIMLAILLIIAGANGEMPSWARALALLLVPASGVAAVVAGAIIPGLQRLHVDARWLAIVPGLAVPLLVFYALWAYYPSIHAAIPAGVAGGVVWGLVAILSVAPWPMVSYKSRADAEFRAAYAKRADEVKARFEKLTPESPLWEWLPFLDDYPYSTRAMDHIRASPTRQSDAEAMLDRGDYPLGRTGHSELELDPTPEFCDKLYAYLEKKEQSLRLAVPQSKSVQSIAPEISGAIVSMIWLHDNGRDTRALGAAYFATANTYKGDLGWDGVQLRMIKDGER
jgi:hypothetical protein